MSFRSMLARLRSVPPLPRARAAGRRAGFRPRLESLEDREVPATFTVLNLADNGNDSLRAAVAAANANPGADLIEFAEDLNGTITLGSELSITDDLTINGLGEDQLTVSGSDATRVFHISGGTTDVEITGLTIADGSATGTTTTGPFGSVTLGGGILNNGGDLIVSRVTLADNKAVGFNAAGGAIANVFGATLTVDRCTFTGNASVGTREAAGGGIANDAASTLTVARSTFTGNQAIGVDASAGVAGQAFGGGAISNRGGSLAAVSHSTFASNLARGGRGADGGPAQNGGNSASGVGGAIANQADSVLVVASGSTLTVEYAAFTGNQAIGGAGGNGGAGGIGGDGSSGSGGAIANGGAGSTALVTHSKFIGNQALGGAGGSGGVGKRGGNGGVGQGGAITQHSAALTVEYSTFTDNQATGGTGGNGGAAANGGAGGIGAGAALNSGIVEATPNLLPTLTADHLMIRDNRATGARGGDGGSGGNGGNGGVGSGGGIRSRGTASVANSQLIFNQATGGAGGDRGDGGLLGGTGGLGFGGGMANLLGATGIVSNTSLDENQAIGGAGGLGGNGGNGQGGGIWNGRTNPVNGTPSTLTILDSTIVNNRADGGAAGVGGSAGQGVGGGIYILPGGSVFVDLETSITGNHASTSDDDVFGDLSFI